jgi:hypothetical protein
MNLGWSILDVFICRVPPTKHTVVPRLHQRKHSSLQLMFKFLESSSTFHQEVCWKNINLFWKMEWDLVSLVSLGCAPVSHLHIPSLNNHEVWSMQRLPLPPLHQTLFCTVIEHAVMSNVMSVYVCWLQLRPRELKTLYIYPATMLDVSICLGCTDRTPRHRREIRFWKNVSIGCHHLLFTTNFLKWTKNNFNRFCKFGSSLWTTTKT